MKGTAGAKYNLMSLEDALSIRLESIILLPHVYTPTTPATIISIKKNYHLSDSAKNNKTWDFVKAENL